MLGVPIGVLSGVLPMGNVPAMPARRSPWMNERAQLLVRLLDERFAMTVSEDTAREDISNHVDHVAERMRIGRQAAKYYVTEEAISDMADRIGREVNRQLTKRSLGPQRHLGVVRG